MLADRVPVLVDCLEDPAPAPHHPRYLGVAALHLTVEIWPEAPYRWRVIVIGLSHRAADPAPQASHHRWW